MAAISFDSVTKRFDEALAVDGLDLEVLDGELLVLLGPSGCGKTTALRMVAGLETPSEGKISIGGAVVNDVDPKDRDVAMVFQSYALYPHLSVARNIEFPLRQRRIDSHERRTRAEAAAKMLGLDSYLDRKPGQLSGGQRQRVALARAIVRQPRAFLMDEPLSNLDATLRVQTRGDIVDLQHRLGITTLYVTHDQVEAMTMGDRIAVIDGGRLQQVAPPQELYDRPSNTFVAQFLGSPGMNLVAASLQDGRLEVGGAVLGSPPSLPGLGTVLVGVRPESTALAASGVPATVVLVEVLGSESHVICETMKGERIVVRQANSAVRPRHGDSVILSFNLDGASYFDPDDGRRIGP
jgi:multiple sugar transport system ATP-binding protein